MKSDDVYVRFYVAGAIYNSTPNWKYEFFLGKNPISKAELFLFYIILSNNSWWEPVVFCGQSQVLVLAVTWNKPSIYFFNFRLYNLSSTEAVHIYTYLLNAYQVYIYIYGTRHIRIAYRGSTRYFISLFLFPFWRFFFVFFSFLFFYVFRLRFCFFGIEGRNAAIAVLLLL